MKAAETEVSAAQLPVDLLAELPATRLITTDSLELSAEPF